MAMTLLSLVSRALASPARKCGLDSDLVQQPARYSRRVVQEGEVPHDNTLKVRVRQHPVIEIRLGIVFHRLTIPPNVHPTVGIRLGVRQPSLRDETGQVGESGSDSLAVPAVIFLGYVLKAEVDDLDVHDPPSSRSSGLLSRDYVPLLARLIAAPSFLPPLSRQARQPGAAPDPLALPG